ncbi:zinc-binding dehydrogenase [Niveispirillum fermenti]|uniref:zinc-binding dehydrogenase n=1 Tax=Niveispirillum fermenti TaxID=1233113 RepID=UPI003A879499
MPKSREVVLKHRIETKPVPTHFEIVERIVPDHPGDGKLLVRILYLTFDPYLGQAIRGQHMGEPHPDAGEPLPGYCVAEVVASGDSRFAKGDHVVGQAGWGEFGMMDAAGARKVDPSLGLAVHLGLLGTPGLTAWAGVTQLARVSQGDVFTIDAAAGAVGGTAGQLAKILGARAVGIAGGPEKCAQARDVYGFDDCIDYRQPDWIKALTAATGGGPSVHFENVGASVLLPVLSSLRIYGRVVLCGLAEHYHADGPRPTMPIGTIIGKRAHMLGLVVYDFFPRLAEWVAFATPHIKAGRLVELRDVSEGIDTAPQQFDRLLQGNNLGKTLVRVDPSAIN